MGLIIWLKEGQIPPGNMYFCINLFGAEGLSTTPIVCNKNIPSSLEVYSLI